MGKRRKIKRYASGNPDLRHRSQMPAPEIAEIEQRLHQLLSPALLAPRLMERPNPKDPNRPIRMRARLLTLPVMMAIILSLVSRRLPSLAEAQRLLERDGPRRVGVGVPAASKPASHQSSVGHHAGPGGGRTAPRIVSAA